jgi:hypothetical protein
MVKYKEVKNRAGQIIPKEHTIGTVTVKPHTTQKGSFVKGYTRRDELVIKHPVVRPTAVQADTVKFQPTRQATEPISKSIFQINAMEPPRPITNADNTSSVYTMHDENSNFYYLKTKSGEAWQGKRATFEPDENGIRRLVYEHYNFKTAIDDDRITERELCAYELNKNALGNIINIPETRWANVNHPAWDEQQGKRVSKNFGEGIIQKDAHELFKGRATTFDEFNMQASYTDKQTPIYREAISSALTNGGMDLACFDYIIGNTDRHASNFFIGGSDETGYKMAGIDHGLSFPNETKFNKTDFAQSFNGLWKLANTVGANIECSPQFKEHMLNDATKSNFQTVLDKSALNDNERRGVMERLDHIQKHIKTNGSLTGSSLQTIINSNSKTFVPVKAPETIEVAKGVHKRQGEVDNEQVRLMRAQLSAMRKQK